ncbi:Sex-determining fem-1 [Fusarium sp. NRRL 52700]|nr:Sex-determining fem-1 [Fusarium sp. NRRL 52700]
MIGYEYLVKDTPLTDLVILLRAQGLHITKGQLEYKLKSWNLSKNIGKETWQYIDRKIRKRRDDGKDSDVIHCGKRLKKVKVKKETNRHRETNIFARLRTPPPSPECLQLSICTPPALYMGFEWPSSLPWLRMRDTWNATIKASTSNDVIVNQNDEFRRTLSSMMRILAPHSKNLETISLSKLIAGFSKVMPEWYPEEHVRTAQNLISGPASDSFAECFKVMVYMMSNSMATDRGLSFVIDLIRTGKIELRACFNKFQKESPTIQSFLENAFQFEIKRATSTHRHQRDPPRLEILSSLLELGLDPDHHCYINRSWKRLCTPIQEATRTGCLELIQLLLRFQARADRTHISDKRVALVNLALNAPCSNSRKLRILAVLFEYQFLNEDEMVRAAIELHDEETFLSILDCGIDITSYESSWLNAQDRRGITSSLSYIARPSVLMMAVQAGGGIASLMLDHLLVKGQLSPSTLADAYIAAAYGGHHDIMLRLDAMHAFEMVCNTEGITPLQAVAVGGDPTVCKHILERHGGSTASLILASAILGNVEIVQLLIEYGGDPNALISTHDIKLYDYFNIGQQTSGYSAVVRLSNNRQFIQRHYGHPTPILSILMHSVPDFNLMEHSVLKLIQNGATIPHVEIATFSRLCVHACLKAALDAGGNANYVDERGHTVLQCALENDFVVEGDERCSKLEDQVLKRLLTVELLLHAGAKLTGGEVVRAIELRERPLILLLLQNGGTLNDVDNSGRGCLEAEIEAQNDRTLQDVLEAQGFPIDAGPFCASIQRGDWALVRRLFERPHHETSCHLLEGTAVGLAAMEGQLDILGKLLARFTDPSVLCSAIVPIYITGTNVIPFIDIDYSDIDYWDHAGFWPAATDAPFYTLGSPLAIAALGKETSGFGELLRRGCKMDTVTWATIAKRQNSSDYLPLLQEFDCGLGNATEYDQQLRTALYQAITHGKSDLAQYLVEVGADANEYDIFTRGCVSPLQCAMREGFVEVAEYLLERKADINAPPAFERGATALQFAAIGGHIGLAGQLLQLGANVNARGSGKLGRSALEGAAEHGRLDMLALLVHHGAVTRGRGRQQLINSVAFAQQRAHNTAAEWLKKTSGWSDADQHDLEFVDVNADYPAGKCIIAYCCDEYHDSDTQCVYHYREEEREIHYADCERCEEIRFEWEVSSESNFPSEDEQIDSGMEALLIFLGFLALSAESVANGSCETSLGSSTVNDIHTSTTTREGTITITDKVIIQTAPLNVTKSKTTLTWATVTEKVASQRDSTVGQNTRSGAVGVEFAIVSDKTISRAEGNTTTLTLSATFTKLVTVTASPEVKIATITITSPSLVNRTETMTKTERNNKTVTTTAYYTTTIMRRPGFTAIRDKMERISSELSEKTSTVGLDPKLFSYTLSVICTDDMRVKTTVTTTSFKAHTQSLAELRTSTSTVTVWTTLSETQYPAGLATTVTTTVHPMQTAPIKATKTIVVGETIKLQRRIPKETHYQVCDRNSSNYLSWAPGENSSDRRMIKEFSRQDHEVNPTEVRVDDHVACCNECMKRKYCRISFWGRPPGAELGVRESCYLYITINWRQCIDGAQPLYARYMADKQVMEPNDAPLFIFSNGPCGQLKLGGVKGDKWHKPMKHDGFDKWNVMDDEGHEID